MWILPSSLVLNFIGPPDKGEGRNPHFRLGHDDDGNDLDSNHDGWVNIPSRHRNSVRGEARRMHTRNCP
jgi:hypothetical protein